MEYNEKWLTEELDNKIDKLNKEISALEKEKEEKLIKYRKSIFTVGTKLKLTTFGCGADYQMFKGTISYIFPDNSFALDIEEYVGIYKPVESIDMDFSNLKFFDNIEVLNKEAIGGLVTDKELVNVEHKDIFWPGRE